MSTTESAEAPLASEEARAAPFPSVTRMREVHTELLRKHRALENDKPSPELLKTLSEFIRSAVATGAILERPDERNTAQGFIDYWLTVIYRYEPDWIEPETTLAEFDASHEPELAEDQCPYVGLETFTEEKAGFFFGRKNLVGQWLTKLNEARLLVVVGPSGSGKASLITAGVLPRLRNGEVKGSAEWRYVRPVAPGAHPLRHVVEAVLGDDEKVDTLADEMKKNAQALVQILEKDSAQPAVLVFPRFEEVFTLADEKERRALGDNLLAVIQSPRGHRVLLAIRNDFLPNIGQLGTLQSTFQQAEVFVPPLDSTELRDIIEQPAERIGLRFEEKLVDALIYDVLGDPAALPLLQFTLLKLWKKRERNRITWRAYNQIGGCRGAFEGAAEEMWNELDPETQEAVRSILLRIVQPGSGRDIICGTVRREALYTSSRARSKIDAALQALFDAGLIRLCGSGADGRIGIINEALPTKWPRLVEWIEEQRATLRERRRFTIAAAQWMERAEDPAALLRGGLLEEAATYADLSDLEQRFLSASQAAQRARDRTRKILKAAAALLGLVLLTAGYFAFRHLERAMRVANVERGMRLLDGKDAAGGAVWFVEALKLHPRANQKEEVYRRRVAITLRELPRLLAIFPHDREVPFADISADATRIATLTSAGERTMEPSDGGWGSGSQAAWLWTADKTDPLPYQLGGEYGASCVRISPDGRLVAVGFGDNKNARGEVRVWETAQPKLVATIACDGPVAQIAWSLDSQRFAIGQEVGKSGTSDVILADASGAKSDVRLKPFAGKIGVLVWSGKGDRIAIAPQEETNAEAQIWDLKKSEQRTLEGEFAIKDIVFSSDGDLVLTASGVLDAGTGAAQLWKAATGKRVGTALTHRGAVLTAQFGPDDKLIVTASTDGNAKIWSASSGRELLTLPHESWVYWAAFSPDGRHIATGSRDRKARVWELLSGELVCPPMNTGGTISRIAFADGGRRVLTVGGEAPRLWAFATAVKPPPALQLAGPIAQLEANGDGTRMATLSEESGKGWHADVWEIVTGKRVGGYFARQPLTRAALNENGSLLVLATDGGDAREQQVLVVDVASGEVKTQFPSAPVSFVCLGHGKASPILLLTNDDKKQTTTAQLWSSENGQPLSQPLVHDVQLQFAAFSPDDSRFLVTGGSENPNAGKAFLRRTGTPAEAPIVLTHAERINRAAFSEDGSKIVTVSNDNGARVWSAVGGKPLCPLLTTLHTADLTDAAFDPSGTRIVTASYDAYAVVTDWQKGKVLGTLNHRGVVHRARFNKDGSLVVTASADGTARLWHPETNEEIALLKPGGEVKDVIFSADGKSVTTLAVRSIGSEASFQKSVPVALTPDELLDLPRSIIPTETWDIESAEKFSDQDLQHLSEIMATQVAKGSIRLDRLSTRELIDRWRSRSGGGPLDWLSGRDSTPLNIRYLAAYEEESAAEYHARCAAIAEAGKQWYGAAWHLTRLLTQDTPDPALLERRALAYLQLGKPARAFEDLSRALEAKPNDTNLLKTRARALIASQLVVDEMNAVLRTQPDDATLQARRAEAFISDNAWQMAEDDSRKAIASADDSSRTSARLILAALQSHRAQWPEALQTVSDILKDEPRNHSAWQRLALLQLKSGNIDAYHQTCAYLIDQFQSEPRVGSIIAWPVVLCPNPGADTARLVEIARRAVEDSSRNYYRVNTLAAALYRDGKYPAALAELDRSRSLFASSVNARISALRDDSFAQTFSEPRLGRAQDWAFCAMANFQLGNKGPAEWWLAKLGQAESSGLGTELSERRLWNRLELGLLIAEAKALITPASPPVAAQ